MSRYLILLPLAAALALSGCKKPPVKTTEAEQAARRAGLSDAMLFDILSHSTGDSRVMRARYPGLGVDDAVWDHSTFSKNRDRLLNADVAAKFFA